MKLNPYLTFDGRCEEALTFYERCLGGRIVVMMRYQDSPMAAQMPSDWGEKIIHATFGLADQIFGAADAFPGSYRKPQGFSVALNIETAAEADRIFILLADHGDVQMPVQETFWALRFGMVVDQFGTPWMINCGKPE